LVDWDRTKYRLHQSQPPWFCIYLDFRMGSLPAILTARAVVGQQLYETKMNSMSSTTI
jgi:hypothetical protein